MCVYTHVFLLEMRTNSTDISSHSFDYFCNSLIDPGITYYYEPTVRPGVLIQRIIQDLQPAVYPHTKQKLSMEKLFV